MKLKKTNAVMGILTILFLLLHMGYSIYTYLTFYYNPFLSKVFQVPVIAAACLHAVLGMLTVFLQHDGGRPDLYPKQNRRTILQRVSAALIFPLLILHMRNFSMMEASAKAGRSGVILLLILAELIFFAAVITHVATSLTNAFITLGVLASRDTQQKIDRVIYVLGAVCFAFAVYAVVRGQIFMFLAG